MARWHEECAAADAVIARYGDLSDLAPAGRGTVRAYLLKVLQEYARHNGHADIIRERIDGRRGE
ncbi:DinB family protein [Kribbella sp. NBC_01245]